MSTPTQSIRTEVRTIDDVPIRFAETPALRYSFPANLFPIARTLMHPRGSLPPAGLPGKSNEITAGYPHEYEVAR